MEPGWIYILFNHSYRELVKVGMTERTPAERAAELHTTSVPHPFVVVFEERVSDARQAETLAHEALDLYRESENREFFRVEVAKAIKLVAAAISGLVITDAGTVDDAVAEAGDSMRGPRDERTESEEEASRREAAKPWRYGGPSRGFRHTSVDEFNAASGSGTDREHVGFSTVERATVLCLLCGRRFSVTLRRYEYAVRCPDCHHLQPSGVEWR